MNTVLSELSQPILENDYDADFWMKWKSIPKEVERQFAPIMWIGNKDKRQTYNAHVQISTDETSKARQQVPNMLAISYGNHPEKLLDVYGTDLPEKALTLLYVHGGYWRAGDRSWAAPFVRNSYSWGVRSVVVEYPFAPKAKLSEICTATMEALAFSMKKYPQSRFVVAGHSAGVQLLLSLFHRIPNVDPLPTDLAARVIGAFLLSGPYDMRPILDIPSTNVNLKLDMETAIAFSAVLTMDKIHPMWLRQGQGRLPFFVGVGEKDPPGMQRHARIYANLLRDHNFPVTYQTFMGEDHFTIVDNLVNPDNQVTKALGAFLSQLSQTQETFQSKL